MGVDNQSFKDALAKLGSSVSIISIVDEGLLYACTISSLNASNVLDPELMFQLTHTSKVGDRIKAGIFFSISVLGGEHAGLATYFANPRSILSVESHSKDFARLKSGDTNFAVLPDSPMYFLCKFNESIRRGNSEIYFSKIIGGSTSKSSSLIYQNRKYHSLD